MLATVSSATYIYLLIGLVIGFIAYRSSEKYKRDHNVTPWHLPLSGLGVDRLLLAHPLRHPVPDRVAHDQGGHRR